MTRTLWARPGDDDETTPLESVRALLRGIGGLMDGANREIAEGDGNAWADDVVDIVSAFPRPPFETLAELVACSVELDAAGWSFHDTYTACQARQSGEAVPAVFVAPLDRAAGLLKRLAALLAELLPLARIEAQQLEAADAAMRAGRARVDDRGCVVLLPGEAGESMGVQHGA